MKFDKVYVGIIVVLVLVIVYVFVRPTPQANQNMISEQDAANTIRGIYELQYESPANITNVENLSGIYKVTVLFTDFNGNRTTQDIFITTDGKLITDRFIIADNYRIFLLNQKKFVECMRDRGLRILGKSNDTATLQQLQILGTYSYKLFVSCDGTSETACTNLGVTRYPTAVYNSTGYSNIYTADVFSQLTGCNLTSV